VTVSKTTQEKAQAYIEARFVSEWQQNILVPCFVDFADSLTAELQKENARLEKLVEWAAKVLLQHMNDEDYEASLAGIYATLTEAALSKEDSRG
jgi:hypothetical protein